MILLVLILIDSGEERGGERRGRQRETLRYII